MIEQTKFSLVGAEGKTIFGDLTAHQENQTGPIIIFVHGFKGFKDWGAHNLVARHFAQNGYRYIKFNLSHCGVTADNPNDVTDLATFANNTFSRELLDVDLVIKFVANNFKPQDIFLIGHSRGGGLSIITAANNPHVKGLITWSAIGSFNSLWKKEQEADWRKTGKIEVLNARTQEKMPLNLTLLQDFEQHQPELDILAHAKQINVPWLIVHGTDDVNVPFEVAQTLANAQPNSKLVKIEGANHVYGANHPFAGNTLPPQLFEVTERTIKFLNAF